MIISNVYLFTTAESTTNPVTVRPNAVFRFWLLNIVVAPTLLDFHEFDPGSLIYMQFSVSFLILLSFHRGRNFWLLAFILSLLP